MNRDTTQALFENLVMKSGGIDLDMTLVDLFILRLDDTYINLGEEGPSKSIGITHIHPRQGEPVSVPLRNDVFDGNLMFHDVV
jgi:hypothetical protein